MAGELQRAEKASPAYSPKYKRLSNTDRAFALRYAKDGLTQTEIAKRLNVSQPTISDWLSQCADTKVEAGQYLNGQALPLAIKAVKKSTAADAIKLLQSTGVIGDAENGPKVAIYIGGQDVDVQVVTGERALENK